MSNFLFQGSISTILIAIIFSACSEGNETKEMNTGNIKNQPEEEVSSSEFPDANSVSIKTEIITRLEDSLILQNKIAELDDYANKYCNCIETASSAKDCKSLFAKLAFELDEDLNNRISENSRSKSMRAAGQILARTSECDKDFN